MIPYAALQGELSTENEKIDISVLDLSFDSFTFRLPGKRELKDFCSVILYFYRSETADYQKCELGNVFPVLEEEEEYANVWRVNTDDMLFCECSLHLIREYQRYINMKEAEDDALLSKQLCRYPAEKEDIYSSSVNEWIAKRIGDPEEDPAWKAAEFGLEIASCEIQELFLSMDKTEFVQAYAKMYGLQDHPLFENDVKYVSFGDGFCFHRLPQKIHELLTKAERQGMIPSVNLPPMKERYKSAYMHYLDILNNYAEESEKALEVTVNDLGTLSVLKEQYPGSFTVTMGVLLNKRRKDSRLIYKNGYEKQKEYLRKNSSNDPAYREELKKYQVHSFAYESCGYDFEIPEGEQTVYFPLYQMNTAGHCTLRASVEYENRAVQKGERDCPMYCSEYLFLYPDMLKMIGIGNTVYGFDEEILKDPAYFARLSKNGTNRMILKELPFSKKGGAV